MATVVLVVHIMIALALVGVILLQRSEGGGLGLGSGTMGGLMTGRGTANLLTRTTAILAACFIATSIVLAILSGNTGRPPSILDVPAPTAPAVPAVPTPPVAQ
ncbi:MAG: preprotein translocase subunit SecG [Geminicoccaceae bacterium]|nr:preprotein translocase subunit SecG [Geminicoccaceae bacterium]MCX8101240.1 preprotein translocase subunit SecG [Geminicoccaceae bacterium]MDW8370759.1 preprotein translocase subunit SecG [Geminicoccaceae bacterium]